MNWADKKAPVLTLVLAAAVHGVVIVWWASGLTSRVDAQEVRVTQNEQLRSSLRERLVRIETIVERVEKKLDILAK